MSGQESSPTFIHRCFYTLFFITPLLLWPYTSEVFEFNKMIFVYLMTVIIGSAWALRSIQTGRFQIVRTPLDIPLLLFLGSQILSTIFSIDHHTSLWGYYSRSHGGLISTICYLFLFYALVTHFNNNSKAIRKLIISILSTATITAIYALLEKVGIDKHVWVQDVQNRVFSTLGQPNWLSAYLVAVLPLSFLAIFTKHSPTRHRLIASATSIIYLLAILFTRSQSGIGATAVILTSLIIATSLKSKHAKTLISLLIVLTTILIFKNSHLHRTLNSLNKINPFYSNATSIITEENKTRNGGSDSMAIRRVVWQGAIELGRRYPLFGTGVETFGYTYYWVRPPAHNLTSESDFLYNKAHNEYLNFLANSGYLGLLTYLFLIVSVIKVLLQKQSDTSLNMPLFFGFLSILITNFFGFSVVNIGLFFFLFPAISLATNKNSKTISLTHSLNKAFSSIIIFITSIWLVLGVSRLWRADLAYNAGKTNLPESLKALSLNPHEPLYYSQVGYVQSLIATQIISPQIKNLTATTSADLRHKALQYLEQYTSDAIKNVTQATKMNPYNLSLLKTKARTELTLATIDSKYNQDALKTLLKITEFSPTEAHNYYNIGLLYSQLNQKHEAIQALQKAIDLKPDYQAAIVQIESLR